MPDKKNIEIDLQFFIFNASIKKKNQSFSLNENNSGESVLDGHEVNLQSIKNYLNSSTIETGDFYLNISI